MKSKILLPALLAGSLCFSAAISLGQIKSLEIGGPHEAGPGQLVRLTAVTDGDETPFWLVLKPSDLDYEQVESGARLIFSTGCQSEQTLTILLLAQQVKDGRIITRQLRRTIRVSAGTDGDLPKTPDDEGGDPEPIPQEDWEASPAYDAVKNAMTKITSPAARMLGPRVADNLDLIAKRCRRGEEISEKDEIWKQLSVLNRESLDQLSNDWSPVGVALQKIFFEMDLPDVESHRFHLQAAALAIRNSLMTPATPPKSSPQPNQQPTPAQRKNTIPTPQSINAGQS